MAKARRRFSAMQLSLVLVFGMLCVHAWRTWRSIAAASLLAECASVSRANERPGRKDGVAVHIVHVPKTSGTTLSQMLHQQALKDSSLAYTVLDHKRCREPVELNGGGFYVGHRGFGIAPNTTAKRFTVLLVREPLSRALSHANFIQTRFWQHLNQSFAVQLHEYRAKRATNPLVFSSNKTGSVLVHVTLFKQLSMLAGDHCVIVPSHHCLPYPDYFSADSPCSIANMKRAALENIRMADAIVVADHQDETLLDMAQFHFNLNLTAPEQRVNTKKYNGFTALNEVELGWMREYLEDEIDVYNEAVAIAARQAALAKACNRAGFVALGASRPAMLRYQ